MKAVKLRSVETAIQDSRVREERAHLIQARSFLSSRSTLDSVLLDITVLLLTQCPFRVEKAATKMCRARTTLLVSHVRLAITAMRRACRMDSPLNVSLAFSALKDNAIRSLDPVPRAISVLKVQIEKYHVQAVPTKREKEVDSVSPVRKDITVLLLSHPPTLALSSRLRAPRLTTAKKVLLFLLRVLMAPTAPLRS